MPTYQYECAACDHTFEILQSMLDKRLTKCPRCGEDRLHRLIGTGSGIIFKGSGFYETDYKKKEPAKSALTDSSEGSSAHLPGAKADTHGSSGEIADKGKMEKAA